MVHERHDPASLTPAERSVVEECVTGASNHEIAETLSLSEATVRTHLTHAYAKLGVTGRARLIAKWGRSGRNRHKDTRRTATKAVWAGICAVLIVFAIGVASSIGRALSIGAAMPAGGRPGVRTFSGMNPPAPLAAPQHLAGSDVVGVALSVAAGVAPYVALLLAALALAGLFVVVSSTGKKA